LCIFKEANIKQRNQKKGKKIYESYTGIPIPKNWELHHINLIPAEDKISNLIALPKKIHREYHKILQKINQETLGSIHISANPRVYLTMQDTIGLYMNRKLKRS